MYLSRHRCSSWGRWPITQRFVDDEHLTAGERAWPLEGGNQKKSEHSRARDSFFEEDEEEGAAPPLLVYTPEVDVIVSTGGGVAGPLPPVEHVLGARSGEAKIWAGKLPDIACCYGAFHMQD
jgi:hypothetical protein